MKTAAKSKRKINQNGSETWQANESKQPEMKAAKKACKAENENENENMAAGMK